MWNTEMKMDRDANGWKVDEVEIKRFGQESYQVANTAPRLQGGGGGLPLLSKPFSCTPPADQGGWMVSKLRFDPGEITKWHGSTRPFDDGKTIVLTMNITGAAAETLAPFRGEALGADGT
jgi:hypothetical protein